MQYTARIVCLFAVSALLTHCQKDGANLSSDTENTTGKTTQTELRFSIAETNYQLGALQEEENGMCPCDIYLQNSNSTQNDCSNWTIYQTNTGALSVVRQDHESTPAVRLALLGAIDLKNASLPAPLTGVTVVLADIARTIVPVNDNPDLGTGPLVLQGKSEHMTVLVESRKGNTITGSFQGTVFTTNGLAVGITNGRFSAQLDWE